MGYNNEWGKEAEKIALNYLVSLGYTIRECGWRSGVSSRREIDIIAQDGLVIVFVEVKSRGNDGEDPVEAVNDKKMRMMARSADTYLAMQEHDFDSRFDIISIVGNPASHTLEHIPDAFISPLFTR